MELRFEIADDEVYELLRKVIAMYPDDQHLQRLYGASFLIFFDLKKRVQNDRIVLGRISKTNDLQRLLTIGESDTGQGFDYIIYLDKIAWGIAEENSQEDRIRLLRHELRHTKVVNNDDDGTTKYLIRDHTITDFYEEVELNQDDPRWGERLAQSTESEYERIANKQQQRTLPL